MKILCVDDNVHLLSMLAKSLDAEGHQVELAFDGKQALSLLATNPELFDLMITDSKMPRLDGFGLVERARKTGFNGKLFVFASGLTSDEGSRYQALGVERVFDKPANRELLDAVRQLNQPPK